MKQVYTLMKKCGMPLTPGDLGISQKDTLDALEGSREIRDKYLTSSLMWDLGLQKAEPFAAMIAKANYEL